MLQLLTSILILSGIGAFLALLLEIADSYLADYGEKHILINNEKDLLVKGGSPLLSTLMQENIFIPSACGGKGTCAYCKVKVQEGGGPVLPTETPYLTPEELGADVRLSCQVKVKEDLKIEIPEELFLVRQFDVEVKEIRDLSPEIKGLRLKIVSPEERIKFKPGQYIQLEIPKYKATKGSEYRAYSISSSAEDHQEMSLIITRAEGGAVSTYVHDYLKEGDKLVVNGPFGDFYLRVSERNILMIATGSGLAPIRSILFQMREEKIEREATLFFGAKRRKDLIFYEELKEFETTLPHFSYIPTLSRATDEGQWEGEKGRVTDLIKNKIEKRAAIDVYICGLPDMVEDSVELLKEKGIPEDRIFFDKFE